MERPRMSVEFEKAVKNKFNVYDSLFLNLPFRKISNIGMLIPLLHHVCKKGLESGKDPLEILDAFYSNHTSIKSEEDKIDFMFRVIQYVERQVVLYDSVEDSAFQELQKFRRSKSLKDYINLIESSKGD